MHRTPKPAIARLSVLWHRYENHALRSWIKSSRQSICRRFKALCISLTSALTTTSFASVNAIDPTIPTLVKEA